jgi:hypothetical protein
MGSEQAKMPIEMPVHQEDLDRLNEKRKPKDFNNVLGVQICRLMKFLKVDLGQVSRETQISYTTIYGWVNKNVEVQPLDNNVKVVARYFQVSVDYLAFSTPVTDRDLEIENLMDEFEEKNRKPA